MAGSDDKDLSTALRSLTPGQRGRVVRRLMEVRPDPVAPAPPLVGNVPLLTGQRFFFTILRPRITEPNRWNIPVVSRLTSTELDVDVLRAAWDAVWRHHDGLRTRFRPAEQGWVGEVASPDVAAPFLHHRIPPSRDLEGALRAAFQDLQGSLDLERGPLVRCALIEVPDGRRLVALIAHHLVTDALSQGICANDWRTAVASLAGGRPAELPPRTASLRIVARGLEELAARLHTPGELAYWGSLPCPQAMRLPRDNPDPEAPNTVETVATRVAVVSAAETRELRRAVAAASVDLESALLTALAHAITAWTGHEWMHVIALGSGRTLLDELDTSRTVGWLAHSRLLSLPRPRGPRWLEASRDRLDTIPNRGYGYHLLREWRDGAQALPPEPELLFSFLSHRSEGAGQRGIVEPVKVDTGDAENPGNPRGYVLRLNVFGGEEQLVLQWEYGRRLHRGETIARLTTRFLEALRFMAGIGQA